MLISGRTYSAKSGYRYGFNGKEQDSAINGNGVDYDYGMRVYDARIGKFLSVDPLIQKFPELSSYQFSSNSPLSCIDLDGLEKIYYYILDNYGFRFWSVTDQQTSDGADKAVIINCGIGMYDYNRSKSDPSYDHTKDVFFIEGANNLKTIKRAVNNLIYSGLDYSDIEADWNWFSGYQKTTHYTSIEELAGHLGPKQRKKEYNRAIFWDTYGANIALMGNMLNETNAPYQTGGSFEFGTLNKNGSGNNKWAGVPSKPLTVEYNSEVIPIYRGGGDFTLKPDEYRVTPNGKYPARGLSLTVDFDKATKLGGAFRIISIPEELQIIPTPTDRNRTHFDIIPKNVSMTLEQYQELLNKIKVTPPN